MQPLPEPIGNFILKNAIDSIQLPDGRYYHYSTVCLLLRLYADQETAELREENERLKKEIEQLKIPKMNQGGWLV